MGKHYTLGIFNYERQKICDLYDSEVELLGQAYDIQVSEEMNGYHTLVFSIPYMVDSDQVNYRWDLLCSDHLIRYTFGDQAIWFVANKPTRSKSGNNIIGTVTCSGFESLLKTRNIYMEFDDENGIGTIQYIMEQILTGTGWSYDTAHSDTLLENDGETEKIRSLNSNNKQGALGLIGTACNLFQARPIFDTDNLKVIIKSMNNRQQVLEGEVGRNLNALTVKQDSSNICTRIYVEGEYGDYGYVGIDDVEVDGEPWGVPFVINFDYYRSIGLFTQEHETALATYMAAIRDIKTQIREAGAEMIGCEDALNTMVGQCKFVVYYKSESLETPAHVRGVVTSEQAALHVNDEVLILNDNGTHYYTEWTGNPTTQLANAYGVVKFITKASGKIGAAEVQIEAKEKEITRLQTKVAALPVTSAKVPEYQAEIERLYSEIDGIYVGYKYYDNKSAYAVDDYCTHNPNEHVGTNPFLTAKAYKCTTAIITPLDTHEWDASEWTEDNYVGLFKQMQDIMKPTGSLADYEYYAGIVDSLNEDQDEIESTFIAAMGYLLRDGYWSNQNYIQGQEEFLYADAVKMAEEMSKPATDYTFDYVRIAEDFDIPTEDIQVNAIFKLYDKELKVDDKMFVKKVTFGVDNKSLGKIDVSNQDITLTQNDLGSLLSRMSQLADLIEQKNALYDRAKAISESGSIYADRLNGQIDVMRTQILSSVSNWHTDDHGNILFESADGSSAMMLSGVGFMLANGKDESGNWNWRSYGDGKGFTADEIVAGFLSADRIEAGSIQTSKLAAEVGEELDLSSNEALNAYIESEAEYAAANMRLTTEEFDLMFNESGAKQSVDSAIGAVQDNLSQYQSDVAAYMRFDQSGTLTLGKNGSAMTTKLTNNKMSFMDGSTEVAYISNQNMYITNANVTNALSIGTNNGNGYFDWTVTSMGLGLKWKGSV